MLYKKGQVKYLLSNKCYIKMIMNLSNCMQYVWIIKYLTFLPTLIFSLIPK
jgi:hypothetical protein